MAHALRDNNLDNTDADIDKAERKIRAILSPYNIGIQSVIKYIDSTVFLLSPNSMDNEVEVQKLFPNQYRYEIEYENTTTQQDILDDETGAYLGRMPVPSTSLAIRRIALKKLPRSILASLAYMTVLFALLTALVLFVRAVILL